MRYAFSRIDLLVRCSVPNQGLLRQCGIVALASKAFAVRRQQQVLALFRSQPIANRNPQALGALHPANAGGQVCTEQATIGSLVSQSPDCRQSQIYGG